MDEELKAALESIRTEQSRGTTRLQSLSDRVDSVHRGIYGSNGEPGIVGKQAVQDVRIDAVEVKVTAIEGDRKKLVTGVILAFVGASLAWIRALLPTNQGG